MPSQEYLGAIRRVAKAFAFVAFVAAFSGCGDGTGPEISDVALARGMWSSSQPTNYSFEVSTLTEWGPQSPYYRVTVENGAVVEVRNESGQVVGASASTLEQQWTQILEADKDHALVIAKFTAGGVPVEWLADRENWADDAVHVWVRNFTKR